MVDHRGFKTEMPGPLPGSFLLLPGTLIGSVVFGWMHQALWLVAPLILFIGYALVEEGRGSLWAKREMNLTWHNVFDTWMSGRPLRGYGGFMFGSPVINFLVFGFAWAVSSLL
jgi:hypothetical protein